jgi:uncharacterized protein (DUF1330 family)
MTTYGSYAVANLVDVHIGAEIEQYLRRIDDTLAPFGGHFLVHGATARPVEGEWAGDLIVIGFPERDGAAAWYASSDYQAILPLRRSNSRGWAILVEGVGEPHRATDVLPAG